MSRPAQPGTAGHASGLVHGARTTLPCLQMSVHGTRGTLERIIAIILTMKTFLLLFGLIALTVSGP